MVEPNEIREKCDSATSCCSPCCPRISPGEATLTCVECGRVQPAGERGWRAYLTTDEDDPAEAVVYCPRARRANSGASSGAVSSQADRPSPRHVYRPDTASRLPRQAIGGVSPTGQRAEAWVEHAGRTKPDSDASEHDRPEPERLKKPESCASRGSSGSYRTSTIAYLWWRRGAARGRELHRAPLRRREADYRVVGEITVGRSAFQVDDRSGCAFRAAHEPSLMYKRCRADREEHDRETEAHARHPAVDTIGAQLPAQRVYRATLRLRA
jgi:hypothetical protein